jgi:hypothetical protein
MSRCYCWLQPLTSAVSWGRRSSAPPSAAVSVVYIARELAFEDTEEGTVLARCTERTIYFGSQNPP